MVLDVSEKMVAFKQATQLALEKGNKGLRKTLSEKKKNRIPQSKQNNRDGSQTFLKCSVSLDNPASFESGSVGGEWTCDLADYDKTVNNSCDLKRHYGLYDITLRKISVECNFCPSPLGHQRKCTFIWKKSILMFHS